MKLYQCDWCDKQKGCKPMAIDGQNYDICAECRAQISGKLKGKGEPVANPVNEILRNFQRAHDDWPRLPHPHPRLGDVQLWKGPQTTLEESIIKQRGQNLM